MGVVVIEACDERKPAHVYDHAPAAQVQDTANASERLRSTGSSNVPGFSSSRAGCRVLAPG
jgi:hypothetical protein